METSNQEFIINLLLPYFQDPTTCAVHQDSCKYLMPDGRKCAVGKCLIDAEKFKDIKANASILIEAESESILIPEARNRFTLTQWDDIQSIHDTLATNNPYACFRAIGKLEGSLNINLFILSWEHEKYLRQKS